MANTPGPGGGGTSTGVSSRFVAVTGYVIAGAGLVLLADFSPQFAIGTAALILMGTALVHSGEISTLVNDWKAAIGG